MPKFLISALVAGFLFTGLAAAAPVLDQQQTTLDTSRVAGIGGSGPQILGQVVTSGMAGLLTQVDLPVGCDSPSTNLVVQIRDSGATVIGETVLATQTVSGLSPPASPDWRSIVLATPPFITNDTTFAIVLSSPGGCGIFGSPPGSDPYLYGNGYYQGPPYPPGVWAIGGLDLGFKTFVERICRVPQLVGGSEGEAPGTLARYGCTTGTITRKYSPTVPKSNVISQGQLEGTQLPAGGAVDFVVSLGRPQCKVPNVRGKRLARAKSILARANCRAGAIRKVASSKALKGRVIRQKPAPGTRLSNGGRVNLVLGQGGRR